MGIYDRDYYKERKNIIKPKSPKEILVWIIIIFVILGLILSSLSF
jgi:1,4-dihydroxy-2-naphthoate octaprenyltransferase